MVDLVARAQLFADMLTKFETDHDVIIQVDGRKLRLSEAKSDDAVKIIYMHHFTDGEERTGSWQPHKGSR